MHAAWSVIAFTVLSGAGLGLLIIGGLAALFGLWSPTPADWSRWLGVGALLLGVGLACSSMHLTNPRNAWRAWMRFRSSWLAREAVLAAALFPLLFLAWLSGPGGLMAALLAGLALATLYSTAMIYACLKTIRQWSDPLTVPYYLSAGLASGALIGAAIEMVSTWLAVVLVASFTVIRWVHWQRHLALGLTDLAGATGLGDGRAPVRLLDTGHSGQTFLTREFGGGERWPLLQRQALFGTLLLSALLAGVPVLALIVLLAAQALDRRLFFTEATHVVRLYHGQRA